MNSFLGAAVNSSTLLSTVTSHEVPHLLHLGSHNETTKAWISTRGVSKGDTRDATGKII
jgi:hypothetical protein